MTIRQKLAQLPRHTLAVTAVILIAVAAAWPVLAEPGLLNTRGGGDSPFLLQRLHQLETAVHDGHFPVRWMPDANYGYGYPFYNFYAPLSIYITLLFRFIGFSYVRAIHLSQLAGFITAALGSYALARRWFKSEWAGVLTAAAYTVAPFHMVNVYVRGDSLAEFWAMAFYPLVILAADKLVEIGDWRLESWRRIGWLALAYAALILSHNISALIFSPFLLLFILLRRLNNPQSPIINLYNWLPPLAAVLLAFALSAWFFVPALMEKGNAQLAPVTEGYFHFSNHFRGLDLVQPSLVFDYSVEGGNAFKMGLVQAVTAVLGLLVLLFQKKDNTAVRAFIVIGLAVATFMITPLSRPLWDTLPLLPFTQFPWRFLSVQAFMTSLAVGAISNLQLPISNPRLRFTNYVFPLALSLLLLYAGLAHLQTDHLFLTDADVTAEKLAQYEWFTGNIGSTVSAEYLPPTVQPRPFSSQWLVTDQRFTLAALQGTVDQYNLTEWQTDQQQWQVITSEASVVQFPTLYWPGWRAAVDGEETAVTPSPGSGLITLTVPPGSHTITLRLTRTPTRLAAELVSLLALLVTAVLIFPQSPITNYQLPITIAALLSLAALSITLHLLPEQTLPAGHLTWDFAQMGYLHHDTNGIAFNDGARLTGYDYSTEQAAAGDTFTVTLYWQIPPEEPVTVALTTPAAVWPAFNPPAPPFLVQSQPSSPTMTFHFALPDSTPTGLFVPRLQTTGRPLMPSGETRGDLFLRPFRLTNPNTTTLSGLEAKAVTGLVQNNALTLTIAWGTNQPLSHNLQYSLRLLTADGTVLTASDHQPGYGFLPTSSWSANQWLYDQLAIALPDDGLARAPFSVLVELYEVGGKTRLVRRLGTVQSDGVFVPQSPNFALPEDVAGETAVFGEQIALLGYTLSQQNDEITVTLVWQALASMPVNYTRFVHLLAAADQPPVAQNDSYPSGNSYPTSQWQPGEVVVETVTLPLVNVPPGQYQLAIGFYQNLGNTFPRLPSDNGDQFILPDTVTR
jgi:hypothetical protein